jgi:hypothetical protein
VVETLKKISKKSMHEVARCIAGRNQPGAGAAAGSI